jgi:hypothetical protein
MSADDEDEFGEIMTDADFEAAIDELRNGGDTGDMSELLKIMNENQMISWDEAERIMGDFDDTPVKSSLPPQTRPSEPENDTNVDDVIRKLLNNDPKLTAINLNNMKRTPVPQIKRIIEALRDNTYCEKLCLANMGLYDNDIANLIEIVENSETLKHINVETNYLSGEFFAKLFDAALNTEALEEVKAVNQGVSFSTVSEKEIIKGITTNRGLLKVSINLRLPEGRHKIENATIRNQDIRREFRRRQRAEEAAAAAAAQEKKPEEPSKKEAPRRRSFVAPIGAATAPKAAITPAAATPAKPEPPKPEPPKQEPVKAEPSKPEPVKKGPMKVYRKQSIPTTDPEATSSAASSKPASPVKKSAPEKPAVEEKKPAETTTPVARKWGRKEPAAPEKPVVEEKKPAETPAPATKKWGRKDLVEPEKPVELSVVAATPIVRKWGKKEPIALPEPKKSEPIGVYPRSKINSVPYKISQDEEKKTNDIAKKSEDEDAKSAPATKKVGLGAKTDGIKALEVKSLKTKTDSSDAEKPPSSANEEDGAPKKKKIIKKKIIVKKIVKKKKSIPTESEGEKTATESEREDAAPTTEPPAAPAAKKAPPPVLPKSRPGLSASRFRN